MRILRNITFNEIEIATSINIRSFPEKATTFTTFIEITEIIEKIPDISDADIADANNINTIFENIENAPFKNIIIESAPVRRFTRYRKIIFKIIRVNIIAANAIGIAEASIISADEGESEEENYLSKTIIAKLSIANENKLTYEKAMADLKESQ
jgi:hypothetical protein